MNIICIVVVTVSNGQTIADSRTEGSNLGLASGVRIRSVEKC